MKYRLLLSLSLSLVVACVLQVNQVHAQSTSDGLTFLSEDNPVSLGSIISPEVSDETTDPITFDEFPIDTQITDQYSDRGIVFSGDTPFIALDGDTPTSPVLSGSPRFRGDIAGRFVDPTDGETPVIVESFTFSAGYFNELASTRIEWFDPEGNRLGQRTNSKYGIEEFQISGGNIASWRISIIKTEPAGYAIDNFSFTPADSAILFREMGPTWKNATWENKLRFQEVPGIDHVGMAIDNLVYESHPGYDSDDELGDVNTFYSQGGVESVEIEKIDGVQAQFTLDTFSWNSRFTDTTELIKFEAIPISRSLAESMRGEIQTQIDAGKKFGYVGDIFGFEIPKVSVLAGLYPSNQKGGNDTFTCVGLIEWAAEQSFHNLGQGFIPDYLEAVRLQPPLPFIDEMPIYPLLSPELLYWTMKASGPLNESNQWFHGGFDPVDFIITDSLGRRLGYTEDLGELNEIPNAFYTGDGVFEQFLVPNPAPGPYQIELFGLGKGVAGAIATKNNSDGYLTELAVGEILTSTFQVEVEVGVPGDVNSDGCVDSADESEISLRLNTFATSLVDPADIDGNGIIEQADLELLSVLRSYELQCADQSGLPDLVIQDVLAQADGIHVVIENVGSGPVPAEHDFWVDLYINPITPPSAVNEIWEFQGESGLVWGVVSPAVPMQPGDTLTLSLDDAYYWPSLSNLPDTIPADSVIYAQVDSANANTDYGGVLESHEAQGGLYNNIYGPIVVADDVVITDSAQQIPAARIFLPLTGLPQTQSVEVSSRIDDPSEPLPSRP